MSDASTWMDRLRSSFSSAGTSPTGEINFGKVSPSDRPGKFEYPWDFLEVEVKDKSLMEGYDKLGNTNPQPGSIVHICDKDDESSRFNKGAEGSRLDRRVMLVLCKNKMSFMCLTFCFHTHQQNAQDHWFVRNQGTADEQVGNNRSESLEVMLHPSGVFSPRVAPKKNVTINIEDIWNVENEVFGRLLGEVAPSALPRLVKAVKERICHNLDAAVLPTGVTNERIETRPIGRNEGLRAGSIDTRPVESNEGRRAINIEYRPADSHQGRSTRRDEGRSHRRNTGYHVSYGSKSPKDKN